MRGQIKSNQTKPKLNFSNRRQKASSIQFNSILILKLKQIKKIISTRKKWIEVGLAFRGKKSKKKFFKLKKGRISKNSYSIWDLVVSWRRRRQRRPTSESILKNDNEEEQHIFCFVIVRGKKMRGEEGEGGRRRRGTNLSCLDLNSTVYFLFRLKKNLKKKLNKKQGNNK